MSVVLRSFVLGKGRANIKLFPSGTFSAPCVVQSSIKSVSSFWSPGVFQMLSCTNQVFPAHRKFSCAFRLLPCRGKRQRTVLVSTSKFSVTFLSQCSRVEPFTIRSNKRPYFRQLQNLQDRVGMSQTIKMHQKFHLVIEFVDRKTK